MKRSRTQWPGFEMTLSVEHESSAFCLGSCMEDGGAHSTFLGQPELTSLVGQDKGHDTKTGLFHVLIEWLLVLTVTSAMVMKVMDLG